MAEMKVIDFMGKRKIAVVVSAVLILVSLSSFVINGMKFGLDFTGGTQVEIFYAETPDLEDIRSTLETSGYENYEVVFFGTDQDVLIRIQDVVLDNSEVVEGDGAQTDETASRVVEILAAESTSDIELASSGYVSSQVGDELREQGGLGMLVALGMIMIYIALRFQFKFSVGAVVALAHDVIITLGFFSLIQYDFDLTVLAAVLAVIGYSLNDTIVVSDRIRENFRILRKPDPMELINISITQTFSRTVITSMTTLMVLLALLLVGGESIKGFSIALIVGVLIGTYSSIYVAANVLIQMHLSKEDLMPPVKDDEELDAIP
jgi:preprotein translocase subunit SecF